MNKKQVSHILLLLTALLWGTGFIGSQYALDSGLSPSALCAARFFIAAIIMSLAFIKLIGGFTKNELVHGGILGVFLYLAQLTQIEGQSLATPGSCAFLTTLNVLFVPFLAWAMTKKRPMIKMFFLCLLSFVGAGILTYKPGGGFGFGVGEMLCVICALLYAAHIAYTGIAVEKGDPRRLTMMQMLSAAVLGIAYTLIFDRSGFVGVNISLAVPSILYIAAVPTSLCFFMQTYAQQHADSSTSAVLLSLEGLFGSLFSVILGMEPLTAMLIAGGMIIIGSAILAQIEPKNKIPA